MPEYLSPSLFDTIQPGIYDPTITTTGSVTSYVPQFASVISQNAQSGESWTDTLARLLPTLALANNQRQLLAIQLERARNGQPPLDTQNFGLGVNVGISPDVQKMLLIGLVGIAAAIYFSRRKA